MADTFWKRVQNWGKSLFAPSPSDWRGGVSGPPPSSRRFEDSRRPRGPTAPPPSVALTGAEKEKLLRKNGLEENIAELSDKLTLAEERLEQEKWERAQEMKRRESLQKSISELQEKLRNAEAGLWKEKGRSTDLEKNLLRLKSQIASGPPSSSRSFEDSRRPRGPTTPPPSFEIVRDLTQEFEDRDAFAERLKWEEERHRLESEKASEKERADREAESRNSAEERILKLMEEKEALRTALSKERGEWNEEKERLLEARAGEETRREKELKEIDVLLAENAGLFDALRLLVGPPLTKSKGEL
ncbi:MAG: hypothetical protein HY548_08790 [Elusimicrobia bacterium]|nr:hypothetical protein [Elusimicrobiota bacterium]